MKRVENELEKGVAESVPQVSIAPRLQIALSALLMLHLTAVFIAPLMFASGSDPSPAVRPVFAVFQPYIDLMYLNHGYFFFAPNPGPNHLVQYELQFDDGRSPETGVFPDRAAEWPRLLYHRHFMLSETYNALFRMPQGPPEPRRVDDGSPRARRAYQREHDQWKLATEQWQKRRQMYETLRGSVTDHLKQQSGASRVALVRRQHRPVNPIELREDRVQLNDDETFRILPEALENEVLPWNPTPSR